MTIAIALKYPWTSRQRWLSDLVPGPDPGVLLIADSLYTAADGGKLPKRKKIYDLGLGMAATFSSNDIALTFRGLDAARSRFATVRSGSRIGVTSIMATLSDAFRGVLNDDERAIAMEVLVGIAPSVGEGVILRLRSPGFECVQAGSRAFAGSAAAADSFARHLDAFAHSRPGINRENGWVLWAVGALCDAVEEGFAGVDQPLQALCVTRRGLLEFGAVRINPTNPPDIRSIGERPSGLHGL